MASKIIRCKQHFAQLVCVLFDIEDPIHFKVWLKGDEQNHPEVIVIAKWSPSTSRAGGRPDLRSPRRREFEIGCA